MEVCERNRCVCVTIVTRDVVTGEERLKSLNAKLARITKVRYAVAVKKEEIIVGDLPRKISCACRITVTIITLRNSLASLGFALGFALCSLKFLYFTICQSYNV